MPTAQLKPGKLILQIEYKATEPYYYKISFRRLGVNNVKINNLSNDSWENLHFLAVGWIIFFILSGRKWQESYFVFCCLHPGHIGVGWHQDLAGPGMGRGSGPGANFRQIGSQCKSWWMLVNLLFCYNYHYVDRMLEHWLISDYLLSLCWV